MANPGELNSASGPESRKATLPQKDHTHMNRTKWLAVVAMAVALPALAQERWRDWERERGREFREQPVRIEKRRMEWMLSKMDAQLSDIVGHARGPDRRALNLLRDELNDVRELLSNATPLGPPSLPQPGGPPQQYPPYQQPPPVVVQPPPPAQPAVNPMPDRDFHQLLAAMQRESFANDKLRILEQAAPINWFVVQQVQQIFGLFEFPADRLKAARAMRGRILDTNNYYQLYGAFEFPRDKDELKRILGQ
jgi:uncharacterized protein DUF4476